MVAVALDAALAILLVAGVLLSLAAMIIAQTFYARVALRRAEYALYRALGAKRSTVIAVVLAEAAGVGLLCGVLGVALALGPAAGLRPKRCSQQPSCRWRRRRCCPSRCCLRRSVWSWRSASPCSAPHGLRSKQPPPIPRRA